MGLRINATKPLDALRQNQLRIERAFERLSSGKRINRASDDAAGLAISEKLRAVERALQQGQRNLGDGISLARTAEGGLSEISNTLGRLRELAVQAGNGTLGDAERNAIQAEMSQLTDEISRIAGATQFNGKTLLNGDASGAGAVTLRDGTGADEVVQISIADRSAEGIGVADLNVNDPDALQKIDDALSLVSGSRAELGSVEGRLRSAIRSLEVQHENIAAANSRIRDADIAAEAANRAKALLLQHMGVAMQAQANISASTALFLLR
jgi:flagellin